MFSLGLYGNINGNIGKLISPFDIDKNFCGLGEFKEFPKLYMNFETASVSTALKSQVCVSECPKKFEHIDCKPNSYVTECRFTKRGTREAARFCLPADIDDFQDDWWVTIWTVKSLIQ